MIRNSIPWFSLAVLCSLAMAPKSAIAADIVTVTAMKGDQVIATMSAPATEWTSGTSYFLHAAGRTFEVTRTVLAVPEPGGQDTEVCARRWKDGRRAQGSECLLFESEADWSKPGDSGYVEGLADDGISVRVAQATVGSDGAGRDEDETRGGEIAGWGADAFGAGTLGVTCSGVTTVVDVGTRSTLDDGVDAINEQVSGVNATTRSTGDARAPYALVVSSVEPGRSVSLDVSGLSRPVGR